MLLCGTSAVAPCFLGRPRACGARGAIVRPPTAHEVRVGGRRDVRRPGRRALGLTASGATCVQRLDGSRDSAIHTKYRISLRSSSMREPRYPLSRVVLFLLEEDATPRSRPRTGLRGLALSFMFLGAVHAGVRCFAGRANASPRGGGGAGSPW